MKLKLLTLILLYSVIINLNAQGNYLSGYVVTNMNDTLNGKLKLKSSKKSLQYCVFLDTLTNKKQKFYPSEINLYRFKNGKYFITDIIPTISEKPIFMEYLFSGVVNLYYYKNNNGEYFFYDKGDGVKRELKNTTFEEKINDKFYIRNRNEYIDSLISLVQLSVLASEKLITTKLEGESLINLFQIYHKDMCSENECIVYERKIEREKLHFGFMAGYDYNDFYRNNTDITKFYGLNPKAFSAFKFGVYFDQRVNYLNNDMMRFRLEMLLNNINQNNSNTITSAIDINKYTVRENRLQLFNNLMVNFDLNKNKVKPYILAGLFLKLTLSGNCKIEHQFSYINSSIVVKNEFNVKTPYLKEEFGPIIGFGLMAKSKNKSYHMDLRYGHGFGVIGDSYIQAGHYSFNLSIPIF